ncbi:hypothetical protein cyc_01995 [Cyclospora cayetanensis]|uniref:Mechanosensitive ion channel MscS domain-containing protein n=1 Tax=Cyclospora cayetanensis TaxID=88456 RepID=A0A1D3CTW4_9EIME|nr:hypothetical protein cyc_01995 [Cyclospora cayetanensis]
MPFCSHAQLTPCVERGSAPFLVREASCMSQGLSYSLRGGGGEPGLRLWGPPHEAEEKEDNSDSDEEREETPNRCFTAMQGFRRAVFPNLYPFWWLALPFVVCVVLAAASYADSSDASNEGLFIFTKGTRFVVTSDPTDQQIDFVRQNKGARHLQRRMRAGGSAEGTGILAMLIKQMSKRELTLQGVFVLLLISAINTAAWFACMIARMLLLTLIVNVGLSEQQKVSSLLTTVDPELFYVVWSVGLYIFWQRNLTKGKMFSAKAVEPQNTIEQLYDSSLFGSSLFVQQSISNYQRTLSLMILLLTTRRLIQSAMVFYFELGFMASMSGQVVKYLTKYAALRKLNTKWGAYHLCKATASSQGSDVASQEDDERLGAEVRDSPLPLVMSLDLLPSFLAPSLCIRARFTATSSAVARETAPLARVGEVSPPRSQPHSKHVQKTKSKHAVTWVPSGWPLGPSCVSLFVRKRALFCAWLYAFCLIPWFAPVCCTGIPSQLTRCSIDKCKSSRMHHWLLLQYVAVFPPAVFIYGERIEIDSKAKARDVSDRLFWALAEDAAELTAATQTREPYQHCRPVMEVLQQQNKQGQRTYDQERRASWLGSSEHQKLAATDVVEEALLMNAAMAAGPLETDACFACSALGNNLLVLPPNSGTSSTDLPADGSASFRPDSPALPLHMFPASRAEDSESAREEQSPGGGGSPKKGDTLTNFPRELKANNSLLAPSPAGAAAPSIDRRPAEPQPITPSQIPEVQTGDHQTSSEANSNASGSAAGKGGTGPSDSKAEPIEPLASFESSVESSSNELTRPVRRGLTQHIATLTPFNIAIRSPSVDAEDKTAETAPVLLAALKGGQEEGGRRGKVEGAARRFGAAHGHTLRLLETAMQERAFTPDQRQGRPCPADSLFENCSSLESPPASSLEGKELLRKELLERRRRLPGSNSDGSSEDVELAEASGSRRRTSTSHAPGISSPLSYRNLAESDEQLCGSYPHGPPPGDFPSPRQVSLWSGTGSASGAEEDDVQAKPQQQRLQRRAFLVGAPNINASLARGESGKVGSAFPRAPAGVSALGSSPLGESVGSSSRRRLSPNFPEDEECFGNSKGRKGGGPQVPDYPDYFTKAFVEMFLKGDEVEEFMKLVDLAGHGKINRSMLKRAVVSIYKMRKALLKSLTSQSSICKTVQRMISVVLWVVTLVAMLLAFGVNLNTVLVSGAASISALVVALSYIYQNFVTAVIFVAFTNPYNVGDRVRIDNGEAMYVRNIHTYTTEFVTVHSKPVVYSNSVLFGRQLTNESRSTNATLYLPIRLDIKTPLQSLRCLEAGLRKAIAARPMDFVKDSFSIYVTDVQPGRWLDISIWLTVVEGWGNSPKVYRLRTDIYLVLQSLCSRVGISYQDPVQPVQLNNAPALVQSLQSIAVPPQANPQFQATATHGAAAGGPFLTACEAVERHGDFPFKENFSTPSNMPPASLARESGDSSPGKLLHGQEQTQGGWKSLLQKNFGRPPTNHHLPGSDPPGPVSAHRDGSQEPPEERELSFLFDRQPPEDRLPRRRYQAADCKGGNSMSHARRFGS